MSQQPQLQTVSLKVDSSNSNRVKVHKTSTSNPPRTRNSAQTVKSQIVLQPVIPEADTEDDSSDVRISIDNGGTRTSFTKKVPSRTTSVTSLARTKKNPETKSYENGGFERDSNRSSTHESVASLKVQREQYCCFARWTVFERRLAMCVGVLGAMIFALAIAVGFLAGDDQIDVDTHLLLKP